MNGPWVAWLNDVAAKIVDGIGRASWQGAIAVGIVWLICLVWKRIPSAVRCALWLFVCLKLLVALVPTGIAIPCLPSSPPLQTVVEDFQPDLSPAIAALPAQFTNVKPVPEPPESLSAASFLAALWIIGVAFATARSGSQFVRSWRLVRRALPCRDPGLVEAIADLSRLAGLRKPPRIRVTQHASSVLTFGALRPTILISSETLAECTEEELRMVLAHELAHVRRRDAWLGLIPQAAQTIFFFHPFVWLACREFEFSREAACDEDVISSLPICASHYGHLLVKLGSPKASAASLCVPGVSSHFRLLRRRIVMLDRKEGKLLQAHRRTLALTSLVGALCIAPMTLVQGQKPATSTPPAVSGKATFSKPAPKASAKFNDKPAKPASQTRPVAKIDLAKKNRDVATTPSFPKDPQSVTVFPLRNAETGKVLHILHTLYGEPAYAVVKVAADERTNSIIVTTPKNRAAEVAGLITQLDIPTPEVPSDQQKIIRVIKVRNGGDANKIVPMVKAILKGEAPEYMSASPRDNTILVRTTEANCNKVQELVNLLDWRTGSGKNP